MRVLITGTEGFAGSHLAEHCLAQGDEVWGTCQAGIRAVNVAHILDQLTMRVGDVSSPDFVKGILREARFDALFHLAAVSFVPLAERQPARTYEINFLGAVHLLDAVRTLQPEARVVLASSGEVYGNAPADQMPIREDLPFSPANIFAAGKAAMELATRPFVATYGVHAMLVRPFNHTGPRQRTDFVCSTFAEQVARVERGLKPQICVGDLSPKRDFCDVRDVVRGYRLLVQHGSKGEAYNLSSGKSVSIRYILDTLMQMARVKVDLKEDPNRMRQTQVMDVYGSYEKINKCCGWTPEIPLEKTLRDLLNWHRDQLARIA